MDDILPPSLYLARGVVFHSLPTFHCRRHFITRIPQPTVLRRLRPPPSMPLFPSVLAIGMNDMSTDLQTTAPLTIGKKKALTAAKADNISVEDTAGMPFQQSIDDISVECPQLMHRKTWPHVPLPTFRRRTPLPASLHREVIRRPNAQQVTGSCNDDISAGWPTRCERHSDDESKATEEMTRIATVLLRHCAVQHLNWTLSVEHVNTSDDIYSALLTEARGEDAFTITDDYLRDKFVFIWKVDQRCLFRIRIQPDGLMQLPFQQILHVAVKADHAPWVRLPIHVVDSDPIVEEVTAVVHPTDLHCRRLLSPSPRFGNVKRKYVKILVKVVVAVDASGTQTADLYQTIYCRLVARDHRMPLRHLARRCREAWEDMPQSARDGAEVTCFAFKRTFAWIKDKFMV